MKSCINCKYSTSSGNIYIVCKYFNKVINTKKFNGCSSFKSKRVKEGLTNIEVK